jgi:GNAT superfamily N-acetyltransferase
MSSAGAEQVQAGHVRAVRPDEVDELFTMICELAEFERSRHEVKSTAEDFRVALFGPDPKLFGLVVEHEAALGGFAVWYVNFSTWSGRHGIYLEDLYVRPHLRGHGYGKALLAELAGICVARGYPRLEWWVLDWNTTAIDFYRRIDALSMDEWTVNRLTGEALERAARGWPSTT